MDSDIVIVRDGERYRVVYGHLRLSNLLAQDDAVTLDVRDEGPVQIMRSKTGYVANKNGQRLPVFPN